VESACRQIAAFSHGGPAQFTTGCLSANCLTFRLLPLHEGARQCTATGTGLIRAGCVLVVNTFAPRHEHRQKGCGGPRTSVAAVRVAVEGEQELSVPRAVLWADLAHPAHGLRFAPLGLGRTSGRHTVVTGRISDTFSTTNAWGSCNPATLSLQGMDATAELEALTSCQDFPDLRLQDH